MILSIWLLAQPKNDWAKANSCKHWHEKQTQQDCNPQTAGISPAALPLLAQKRCGHIVCWWDVHLLLQKQQETTKSQLNNVLLKVTWLPCLDRFYLWWPVQHSADRLMQYFKLCTEIYLKINEACPSLVCEPTVKRPLLWTPSDTKARKFPSLIEPKMLCKQTVEKHPKTWQRIENTTWEDSLDPF